MYIEINEKHIKWWPYCLVLHVLKRDDGFSASSVQSAVKSGEAFHGKINEMGDTCCGHRLANRVGCKHDLTQCAKENSIENVCMTWDPFSLTWVNLNLSMEK